MVLGAKNSDGCRFAKLNAQQPIDDPHFIRCLLSAQFAQQNWATQRSVDDSGGSRPEKGVRNKLLVTVVYLAPGTFSSSKSELRQRNVWGNFFIIPHCAQRALS
ncbi:MAG: hypothetical protein JWN70_602 [Planctomycetaceae bacterium]|nr:hypothetical protein [Planctomycetaceae bacterium]